MNNYSGGNGDIVGRRKAEVRKHARTLQISAGVGVVSLAVGLLLIKIPLLAVIVPLICAIVFVYSGVKIKQIIDHKDQW